MSLRVRILQIDVPAAQLDEATTFWAAALDATPVRSAGGFVHLHDARSVVEVHLQPLDAGPARYHLDLEVFADRDGTGAHGARDRRDAEVDETCDLGARAGPASGEGYTVVHDPAGLPLCVIDADAAPRNPLAPRRDARPHLGAIFLDVPADLVDAEVAFWLAALGATPGPIVDDYLAIAGVMGPGGPLDLEVQRIDGPPRLHVDVTADDVAGEAARLEGLGAVRVAEIGDWVVLADPTGNLLCVVPPQDGVTE